MNAVVKEKTRLEALTDYLWRHQRVPFEYGRHDCRTFACRWVDSQLDTNYLLRVEAHIRSKGLRQVLGTLRNVGGYMAMCAEIVGKLPSDDSAHKPGDVAIFLQADNTETLGIVSSRLVHAPGQEGLVAFGADRIRCYWSLECLK